MKNYYGSLCTEMYEILHRKAPQDELAFYLSYAASGMKILEPLCGSGRFLVPFLRSGFNIFGIDLSGEMLEKLREKAPNADVVQADICTYLTDERYDYIFVSSSSISLFTDLSVCKRILSTLKDLLSPHGKLVFSVDTLANRCPNDEEYKTSVCVKTAQGFDLVLKIQNRYDEKNQIQYSPSIYELYDGAVCLQREQMDFQTRLYRFGEMEQYLKEIGFLNIKTYSSFEKEIAVKDQCEAFLFECSLN